VKWTQLISADFSFQNLCILLHLNLGGLSFNICFSKRAVQMFVWNICWLKIVVGDLWIHSTAPEMNTVKRNSERRIPRKSSENQRPFQRVLKDLRWRNCHHSLVEKSAGLNKFGLSAGPRFDSGRKPVNSNQDGAKRPSRKGSKLLLPVIKANKLPGANLILRPAYDAKESYE